jgi:hypothetical protein
MDDLIARAKKIKLLLWYASRVLRESGSGEILTEAGTPTPISFASNSFASQDMLTDPYSYSPRSEVDNGQTGTYRRHSRCGGSI